MKKLVLNILIIIPYIVVFPFFLYGQGKLNEKLKDTLQEKQVITSNDSLNQKDDTSLDKTNSDNQNNSNQNIVQNDKKTKEMDNNFNDYLWIILGLIILNYFIAIWSLIRTYRFPREKIIDTVLNSQRINQKFVSIASIETKLNETIKTYDTQLNKIHELKQRLEELENQMKTSLATSESLPSKEATHEYFFLDIYNDKTQSFYILHKEQKPRCYFRMYQINENQAEYEFYGDESIQRKAIANRFYDNNSCEVVEKSKNPQKVESVEPGLLQYQDNVWKIIKKCKIKLI